MITKIEQFATGQSFEDWQDTLHASQTILEPLTVGNFNCDGLSEEDQHYLHLEATTCGLTFYPVDDKVIHADPVPNLTRLARGVGNWRDPKVVLICERVESTCKNPPRWNLFPYLRRLRPFSGSVKSRKFLHNLLSSIRLPHSAFYITAAKKEWVVANSKETLREELHSFLKCMPKFIAIGAEAAHEVRENTEVQFKTLHHPQFWTSFHATAWHEYRERFREMVE